MQFVKGLKPLKKVGEVTKQEPVVAAAEGTDTRGDSGRNQWEIISLPAITKDPG